MGLKKAIVMVVAIARIADDWVAKMLTVAADLMLPTSYWHRAHQRVPRGFKINSCEKIGQTMRLPVKTSDYISII